MANKKHSEETKLQIGAMLSETRRRRPDSGHIVIALFGKRAKDLTPDEWARYRRLAKTVSYYRRHERNKAQQRKNASWKKLELLQVLGWDAVCNRCGYDKYVGALDFHHLDPMTKDGPVTTVAEARKCELICANCHREAHRDDRLRDATAGKAVPRRGGRPTSIADPLLEPYMRLSGLTDECIAAALRGRPEPERVRAVRLVGTLGEARPAPRFHPERLSVLGGTALTSSACNRTAESA